MSRKENQPKIKDILEFFEHWPRLKDSMVTLPERNSLDEADAVTLSWMIAVMDRIGPWDLEN